MTVFSVGGEEVLRDDGEGGKGSLQARFFARVKIVIEFEICAEKPSKLIISSCIMYLRRKCDVAT